MIRSALIIFALLVWAPDIHAQNVLVLDQPVTGTQVHKAKTTVKMVHGYKYVPLAANTMRAYIDNTLPTGDEPPAGNVPYAPLFTTTDFNNRAINTSKIVGLTSGTADVSPNGAATYNIPISLPPGLGSMMPNLSLVYSSQSGNGLLGPGWNLAGISEVSRVNKNLHFDTEASPISINFNDRLALDGNLLDCGGCDPSQPFDHIYSTEVESFNFILSKGIAGNGPDWFEIETKDGTKMEFGRSGNSKLLEEGGSTAMMWRVNKIYDQYGNYMEFKYNNSDRDLRVEEISYTGNAAAGVLPYNKIKFYYDQRTDDQTLYMAGSTVRNLYLLRKIKVFGEKDLPVKDYEFKYGMQYNNQDQVHSYLKEIIEYASDGNALNSTIMEYGEFQAELSTTVSTTLTNQAADIIPGDFNGDGLTDLLSARRNSANPTYHDYLTIYKKDIFPSSFTAGAVLPLNPDIIIESNTDNPNSTKFLPSDVNGDGRDDIIWAKIITSNGYKLTEIRAKLMNADASGFLPNDLVFTPGTYNDVEVFPNVLTIGDFDGDGRGDIISPLMYQGIVKVFVTYPGLVNSGFVESDISLSNAIDVRYASLLQSINFDGDAKQDLIMVRNSTCKIYSFKKNGSTVQATQLYSGAYPTKDHKIYFGDFNGDGKTDMLTKSLTNNWQIAISKGTSAGFVISTFAPLDGLALANEHKITVLDANGDGLSDIVHTYGDPNMPVNPNILIDVFYSRGDDFFTAPTDLVPYSGTSSLLGGIAIRVLPGDYDGDGNQDFIFRNANGIHDMTIFTSNSFDKARYLSRIADGFNTTTEFLYRSMTNSDQPVYTKGTGAAYPLTDVTIPTFIVKSISRPNGVDKKDVTTFNYEGAILNLQGKGWLGFTKVISDNNPEYAVGGTNTNGFKTTREFEANTTYSTLLPKKKTVCRSLNNAVLVSELTFVNQHIPLSNFNKRVWLRIGSTTNVDKIRNITETASYTFDDYGNITNSVITNGVESVTTTEEFNHWYGSPYPSRPTLTTIAKTRSGEPVFTTVTSKTYNVKGALTAETNFYGQTKAVTTAYTNFDLFGHARTVTTSASGLASRATQYVFDPTGRFMIQVTDALNQISTAVYDVKWGTPVLSKGVDGVETANFYDALGRLSRVINPEGLTTTNTWTWDIKTGNGTNNTDVDNSIYYTSAQTVGRPDVKTWYDRFLRTRKTESEGYNNQSVFEVTTYDGRGNIKHKTAPFYLASTPVLTTNTFDELNRIFTSLTSGTGGVNLGTNTFTYSSSLNGEYTVEVNNNLNPNAFQKSTTDASGKVIRSEDKGGVLKYYYHSCGQQRRVELNDAELLSAGYDPYGRQSQVAEKNSGTTVYVYNAYGELESQTDGNLKNQVTEYDVLGRIFKRTLPEGIINFEYVTTGNGVGHPKKITGYNGYYMEYVYDNFSRPIQSKELINGILYTSTFSFDAFNNNASVTFPSGLAINKVYDGNGYLTHIKNGNNSITLFTANSANAFGQYTSYLLANGKTSTMQYDQFGLPDLFSTPGVQNLDFTFNVARGNLTSRNDILKNKTESFLFDNLNRLTTSTIGATSKTITYKINGTTENGNIDTKTDIGVYEYDPTRVNAVTTVTNPNTTISLLQQDIVFNSLQQPTKITENNFELALDYGPDEMRKRSVLKQGTTVQYTRYFLPDFERTVTASGTEDVHYINGPDGLIAMIVRTNGTDQYYYTYKDYLGSILTVTNAAGTVVKDQNFDAWGRPRNPADWSFVGITANPSWLYRGYTGHEHLSQFALINMNGRIYDPLIGRMLSPDNFVADALSTQAYNRYTYANNNPLSFSDPSGEFVWWIPIAFAVGVGAATGYAKADLARMPDPWKGALKGALVGLATSALAGVGGGVSFLGNIAWGIGEGAAVGTLNAALWHEDVGKGALKGGITGGAFALLTSLPEAIRNYNEGYGFGTDLKTFDKLAQKSIIGADNAHQVFIFDEAKMQNALDYWSSRFGGPQLDFLNVDQGGASTNLETGQISIDVKSASQGSKGLRRSIVHEIGHYNRSINWSNGPGSTIIPGNPHYENLDMLNDHHGSIGYFDAIKGSGKYHIGFDAGIAGRAQNTFDMYHTGLYWKLYGPTKWFYVIPRRF